MKHIFFLLAFAVAVLTGCEKEVNIPLNDATKALVVEATIENGQPPVVFLSNSFGYFSKISTSLLLNSFVRNAVITVSDGSRTITLKEYPFAAGSNTVYVYTADFAAAPFLGKLNTAYSIKIIVDGSTYTAQTTIPALVKKVDSLWAKPAPNNADTTKRTLFARITDPPGLGNYIRYFTSVNDSAFLPGLNSVFDDDVIDGTTYDVQVFKGVDKNQTVDLDKFGYFTKGDTVQTKLCNIDRATFLFWQTLEFSQQSIGNPFSQPGKVLGNISGGALGYFGGYAAQYKKIIISK